MKNESQYGLLLLQRYLYEHTDDQHPASVADILAFWQEHGIQAGRKSVYSAIEVLQSSGMDIVCVKSTQNRYFVGERLFELPELKLLVDAVESSRFITAKKSKRLIEKLGKLTSESHARQLDRHIYMEGTAKPENECIYYSVDEIHNAIQEKRQITFRYYEYRWRIIPSQPLFLVERGTAQRRRIPNCKGNAGQGRLGCGLHHNPLLPQQHSEYIPWRTVPAGCPDGLFR